MNEIIITELQLRRFDGDRKPMYIAYQGVIYDVTDCPHWRSGIHQDLHFPGQILDNEISDAPHGLEVFRHPSIKRIGRLQV